MIPSPDEPDEFVVDQRPSRVDQWLDRMDAAILSVGRAILRAVVDGCAAYGMAQCAPLIDTHHVRIEEQKSEGERRGRAEPVELVHRQPGQADAIRQDSPHGVGMQRGIADPIPGADLAKQRPALRLATACQASNARTGQVSTNRPRGRPISAPCPAWWPRTEDALRKFSQGRANGDPVFLSRHRKRYTRFGVYRLVERCAARVPTLAARAISPHVVRHTSACHLLQARVDLNTIRLGHVSLDTTNIYAEIDLQMKEKAMALCDAGDPGPNRPWKEDKGVIAFLNSI
jgi:hypothetical protein